MGGILITTDMTLHPKSIKMYTWAEIQEVYKRHHDCPGSVVYHTTDNTLDWKPVPMDTDKWETKWIFAFIQLDNRYG